MGEILSHSVFLTMKSRPPQLSFATLNFFNNSSGEDRLLEKGLPQYGNQWSFPSYIAKRIKQTSWNFKKRIKSVRHHEPHVNARPSKCGLGTAQNQIPCSNHEAITYTISCINLKLHVQPPDVYFKRLDLTSNLVGFDFKKKHSSHLCETWKAVFYPPFIPFGK